MRYDYVFATHLPAFYKVNLYNEIAKKCKIFVIFVASNSQIRTPDFAAKEFSFDYCFLNDTCFEQRSLGHSIAQLLKVFRGLSYQKLVVGGWDLPEFWLLTCLSPKNKNALALESSCFESRTRGFKALIKKIFLQRIDLVFCSGQPHQQLLQQLAYEGKSCKTLGVGIFHYLPWIPQAKTFTGKFLYVGRLAQEKNVALLMQAFKELPQFSLTIIGQGPLTSHLASICPSNVKMVGHVPNKELGTWYQQHDVFILPSQAEPWGLVVEEALYFGLPVLASHQVGCAVDLIQAHQAGILFDPHKVKSLCEAILLSAEQFTQLSYHVQLIDFKARDAQQVQCYYEAITA